MAYELVYTSAPQGINRDSSGFCVVACTNGLGPRLIAALEGFSAYKPLYPHYADNAWDNPISRQHYFFEANGERQHILSRICFNGVDYTGRSNKLASHLVLSRSETERVPGGPAALLMREELFKTADWTIKPEHYDRQRSIPSVAGHGAKCATWESVTGDAGWGGYLAQCFLDNPQRNVYLVYRPELNRVVPKLFDEAINLLPEDKRWLVTFNSYFVALPAGGSCAWRGVPEDSDALLAARRSPANIVIDLGKPGTLAATGKLIDFARTGVSPEQPVRVTAPERVSPKEVAEIAPPVDDRPETMPSRAETPAIPVAEPTRPRVVPVSRPVAAAPRKSAKWPIVAAAAVLLVAVLAVGAFFVVGSIRERRAYQQALDNCQKLRQTLDEVEEAFGTLERDYKTAEDRIAGLKGMIDAVKGVEKEINDTTPETEALFDDALGSGKLTDPRNTPGAIRETCNRLIPKLDDALKTAQKKLDRSKRLAELAPVKQKKPESKPEKKAEKPADEPKPQQKKAEKKTDEPKPQQKKHLAKPDDPRTLWKKAEPLYARGTKNISVTVALGDAKREDIKIRLLPDNAVCQPGGKLEFGDANGNNVVIGIEYDESTGVLTITGVEYTYQLLKDKRISVSVGDKDYPLFFKAGFSRPIIGKTRLEISGQGVSLRITQAQLPERIFRESSLMNQSRYALKYGGKEYRMQLANGELQCTFDDAALSKCRKREAELKKLKAQVEKEPEKFILKIGFDDLEKNEALRGLMKDWKEFYKQNDSLLDRARAAKKKTGVKQITSLRKFHDDLSEDAKEAWGEGYKGWAAAYAKWDEMSKRLGRELIAKAPMALLWSGRGNKTLKDELAARRKAVKDREEGLLKERYFLVISESGGKKIDEIELDIK